MIGGSVYHQRYTNRTGYLMNGSSTPKKVFLNKEEIAELILTGKHYRYEIDFDTLVHQKRHVIFDDILCVVSENTNFLSVITEKQNGIRYRVYKCIVPFTINHGMVRITQHDIGDIICHTITPVH